MFNVMLKKGSLNSINSKLKKMQSESESARNKVDSAIRGLDIEVASKHNLKKLMNNLSRSLSQQILLSEQYSSTFVNVANTLVDSDGKFGSESQSIFDKVKSFIEDSTESIKEFFTKNKIAKYSAVAGLFLATPSVLCFSSTKEFLDAIVAWFKKLFGWSDVSNAAGTTANNQEQNNSVETPEEETVVEPEPTPTPVPEEPAPQPEPQPEPKPEPEPQPAPSNSPSAFEPTNYEPTDDLLKFVGAYEGYSSTIYVCPAGKDTIGYGHVLTSEAEYQKYANGITQQQALDLMRQDMQRFNNSLKKFVTNNNIQLTQCQYDALLSFSFNCGPAWMTNGSGLSKLLINGEFDKVGAKLGEYVKGGGQVLPGLVNRRADEAELFNNGDYIRNH